MANILDTITCLHLTTGALVMVEPGTFRVGTDPLFPGRPVALFTSPRTTLDPVMNRVVPLDALVMVSHKPKER